MDTVPGKVTVRRFRIIGTIAVGTDHFAVLAVMNLLRSGRITQRRGTEQRYVVFFRQFENRDSFIQVPGDRFVDKHRLAGFHHLCRLFEVHVAVVGLEQHIIHLLKQVVDRTDDLDAVFLYAVGVSGNPFIARRNRVRSVRVGGYDPVFSQSGVGPRLIIERFDKSNAVRGIETDHPDFLDLCGQAGSYHQRQQRQKQTLRFHILSGFNSFSRYYPNQADRSG